MVKQTAGKEKLGDFAPKFAEINDDILFGEIWSREDKLSLRDRLLITICIFMGKGLVDNSLKYHLTNARNNWHIHKASKNGGQILICVDGEGWYQEEGKKPQSLKIGDVVTIPANVKHWHGAKKDKWFSHLAIEVPGENTSNEWCEKVTNEEYDKL